MIVCVCARVSDRQIHKAVANGAHSLECLQFELGVAVQCGNCADCASRVLGEACAHAGGGHAARHHPVHFLEAAECLIRRAPPVVR